jgi:hypothetical protein
MGIRTSDFHFIKRGLSRLSYLLENRQTSGTTLMHCIFNDNDLLYFICFLNYLIAVKIKFKKKNGSIFWDVELYILKKMLEKI